MGLGSFQHKRGAALLGSTASPRDWELILQAPWMLLWSVQQAVGQLGVENVKFVGGFFFLVEKQGGSSWDRCCQCPDALGGLHSSAEVGWVLQSH